MRLHGMEWGEVRGPVECYIGTVEEKEEEMERRRWKTTREEVLGKSCGSFLYYEMLPSIPPSLESPTSTAPSLRIGSCSSPSPH